MQCRIHTWRGLGLAMLAALAITLPAQAAENLTVLAAGSSVPAGAERSHAELEDLVGPVALYPDDLLALVLPATTHPLDIVQAARYLEARDSDPSLQPDPDWDESVIGLLNYPEVLQQLNEDLDRTADLGAAVSAQEAAVLDAVTRFRHRAYQAGNLRTDQHQVVEAGTDAIAIRPVDPEVMYVPDYEPARVCVHQPTLVYRYYARPFPVYYYPYPPGHPLLQGDFWGITSAYRIGWQERGLHVYLHQQRGHPYYGRHYPYRFYGFHQLDRYDRYRPGSYRTWPPPAAWPRSNQTWRALAPRGEQTEMHHRRRAAEPPPVADAPPPAAARQPARAREPAPRSGRPLPSGQPAEARNRADAARDAGAAEAPAPNVRRGPIDVERTARPFGQGARQPR